MGRIEDAVKQTYEELTRAAKEVGLSFDMNTAKVTAQCRYDIHIGKEVSI
jgi:hypothetical protein